MNVSQIARGLNSGRVRVRSETAREFERLRVLLDELMPPKRD